MKCPKCKNIAALGLDIVKVKNKGLARLIPHLKKYLCTFCGSKFYKWFY